MKNDFIVLAAGKGLRMLNKEPKVLQHLGGVPMAQHLLNTLSEIENSRPIIVLGDQADKVRSSLRAPRNSKWVKQRKQIVSRDLSQKVQKVQDDFFNAVVQQDSKDKPMVGNIVFSRNS